MKNLKNKIIITISVVLLSWIFSVVYKNYISKEQITITVTKTQRLADSGKYTVSALHSDNSIEVFENTDTWLNWKFNSSDVDGILVPGKTYKVTVNGYRVRLFSWYRNIIEVDGTWITPKTIQN